MLVEVWFENRGMTRCVRCQQVINVGQLMTRVQRVTGVDHMHLLCFRDDAISQYEEEVSDEPSEKQVQLVAGVVLLPTEFDGVYWNTVVDGNYKKNMLGNWEEVIET